LILPEVILLIKLCLMPEIIIRDAIEKIIIQAQSGKTGVSPAA
jgi:hypothetical protein